MGLFALLQQHTFGALCHRLRHECLRRCGWLEHITFPAGELSTTQLRDALRPELFSAIPELRAEKPEASTLGVLLKKQFQKRQKPCFFFSPENRQVYGETLKNILPPEAQQALIDTATRFAENRFDFLGSGEIRFEGDAPDWSATLTGGHWPLKTHWTKVDIRSAHRAGDIKLAWELGRHQYFSVLGRAYWLTGDERFAAAFANHLTSWLEHNPAEQGIHWMSNLELAMRAISWAFALPFFLSSDHLKPELLTRCIASLYAHAKHLEKDIEFSRQLMPNNHLIGDAAGLYIIGRCFPEFKEAPRWLQTGRTILLAEAEKQFLADGINWEQAPAYQRFVLWIYLLFLRLEELNGEPVAEGTRERLRRGFEFIAALSGPDGKTFDCGDNDDSRVAWLSNTSPHDANPLLLSGAIFFGDPALVPEGRPLSEEALWLFGVEGFLTYHRLERPETPPVRKDFDQGGYYLFEKSLPDQARATLLFECGPMGIPVGVLAGHGHADALQVQVRLGDRIVLRDSGTFTYNGERQWRCYFRTSQAHNVLLLDGRSQAEPTGLFRWKNFVEARRVQKDATSITGEHNAFGVPVSRRVVEIENGWELHDQVTGQGTHQIELRFQANPAGLRQSSEGWRFISGGTHDLLLVPPIDMTATVLCGSLDPIGGWISDAYGKKQAAEQLILTQETTLPLKLVTKLLVVTARATGHDAVLRGMG